MAPDRRGRSRLPQGRHLPEGLQRAIIRFVLIALFEEARLVRQTGFLQRPARAQIAHLALGEIRNPPESRDRDHVVCSLAIARASSKRRIWRCLSCRRTRPKGRRKSPPGSSGREECLMASPIPLTQLFHRAVERHELRCNYLCHRASPQVQVVIPRTNEMLPIRHPDRCHLRLDPARSCSTFAAIGNVKSCVR